MTDEEREEWMAALMAAIQAFVEQQMTAPLHPENADIGRHRQALVRLYLRLQRQEHSWEDEEELALLSRCSVFLRLRASEFEAPERERAMTLAQRLRRLVNRKGYEEFWDGE